MLALKVCWPIAARRPRWCSTRSTPGSAARWRTPSAGGWRGSSERVQVMAVTHAPQVAARADRHYPDQQGCGCDAAANGCADRRVRELAVDRARREEIARMLAGAEITDEARAAARAAVSRRRIEHGEGGTRKTSGAESATSLQRRAVRTLSARRPRPSTRALHRRDRRARQALLSQTTRRLSPTPNTTRCGGAQARSRRFPELRSAGKPVRLKCRREAVREVRQGAPPRADAVARQRVRGRGRARVRRTASAASSSSPAERAAGLHRRAEDRRPLDARCATRAAGWSRPRRAATARRARTSPPMSAPSPRSPTS